MSNGNQAVVTGKPVERREGYLILVLQLAFLLVSYRSGLCANHFIALAKNASSI